MEEILKQLVLSNAAEQQANAAQQQANAIAQEQTRALCQQIGAVQEQSQRLFEQLATAAKADRKTLTEVAQWAPAKIKDIGDKPSAIHVGRFLSKMTTDDDPEAFLLTFEQAAGGKVGLKPSGQD